MYRVFFLFDRMSIVNNLTPSETILTNFVLFDYPKREIYDYKNFFPNTIFFIIAAINFNRYAQMFHKYGNGRHDHFFNY